MGTADEITKRRFMVSIARPTPFWALVNLAMFACLFFDFKFSNFLTSFTNFQLVNNIVIICQLGLMLLFLVNVAYNTYLYIWLHKLMKPIELSAKEYELFGISKNEVGFKLKTEQQQVTNNVNSPEINNPPPRYPASPRFELSPSSIYSNKHSSSLDSTSLSSRLFDSTLDTTAASWSFSRNNQDSPLKMTNSPNKSTNSTTANNSTNNNDFRFRKSSSFSLLRLNQRKTAISSEGDLQRYLAEQEERTEEINELVQAQKRFNTTNDSSSHQSPMSQSTPIYSGGGVNNNNNNLSFTSPISPKTLFGNSFQNQSNLSNQASQSSPPQQQQQHPQQQSFQNVDSNRSFDNVDSSMALPTYQAAIKVSSLPSSPEKSESGAYNHSSIKALEKILSRLNVDNSRLNQMVENIRKWLSQTILVRLVEEIDSINKQITEKGFIDSLIGETSIQQLKHLAESKKSDFSTLDQVISFLDINIRNIENNIILQQYIVRRLRDLAQGGCISEYLWDAGGSYNYKHWKEDMLTDAEIILHMFCVYMDSRLLFNPNSPEGRPFTSQHFKPYSGLTPKSDSYIQQVKSFPPHYSLVLKNENIELPQGRNNLFIALLAFLHHIKVKNFGLLGRINLGPSGLNISWVIDK